MNKTLLVLTLLACPVAAACGDDAGSSTIAPDQIYESMAATYCDVLRSCTFDSQDSALISLLAKATSPSACKSFIAEAFPRDLDIEAEVAAGRMTFDAAAAKTCLASVRASCTLESADACRDVVHGLVALGQPCEQSESCAGDAYCKRASDGCGGTCTARVALGGACTSGNSCSYAAGKADCDYSSLTCKAVSFQSGAAVGAACGTVVTASTITLVTCAAGLICDYDGDAERCVQPAASGAACGDDNASPCKLDEVCLGEGAAAKCTTFAIANKAGDACDLDDASTAPIACNAMNRLACIDKKCVALGDGSLGAVCATDFEISPPCDAGLYCARSSRTCQAMVDVGGACTDSAACKGGYCGPDDKCVADTCGGS